MAARSVGEQQENYRAAALSFILVGVLLLTDRLIGFSNIGADWVMNRSNFLLYIGAIFLLVKRDKTIGLALGGVWVVLNLGKVFALLGSLSGYVLPAVLLIAGIALFLKSRN